MNRSEDIKKKALELGFLACGIARAEKLEAEELHLSDYLQSDFCAGLSYMKKNIDKRLDPTLLVPGARSIIVVLLNYFPRQLPSEPDIPIVAKYAYGKDYHLVLKEKIHQLFQFIKESVSCQVSGRIFTDSAPVLERAWAVKAGLGWIGKNGMLISRSFGSFFFIGELILDLELDYDVPYSREHCGNCTRCLQSCPTRSFEGPYRLDARRCISYHTIESKEELPEDLKSKFGKHIFGCDICQDVCPWNRKSQPHQIEAFDLPSDFISWSTAEWESLNQDQFNMIFEQSALQRAGFEKIRNTLDNLEEGNKKEPHRLIHKRNPVKD